MSLCLFLISERGEERGEWGWGVEGLRVEGKNAGIISWLNSYSSSNEEWRQGTHTSWDDGVFPCESWPGWNGVLGSALILGGVRLRGIGSLGREGQDTGASQLSCYSSSNERMETGALIRPGMTGSSMYCGSWPRWNGVLSGPTCLAGLGQATADVELVCMRFTNNKKYMHPRMRKKSHHHHQAPPPPPPPPSEADIYCHDCLCKPDLLRHDM
jgi:hypothetical protein